MKGGSIIKNFLITILFLLTITGCSQENSPVIEKESKTSNTLNTNIIDIETNGNNKKEYANIYDDYIIDLDINPETRVILGNQIITYTNKSTVPFDSIFINVPALAFTKDHNIQPYFDEDVKNIFTEDVSGYITAKNDSEKFGSKVTIEYSKFDIIDLKIDNDEVFYTINSNILKIKLNDILLPGENVNISFSFDSYIPKINHRFGSNDKVLWLSGFLPTMCVFDEIGWHKESLFAVGETSFSNTANYTLNVKIPDDYTVFGSDIESSIQTQEGIITVIKENLVRNFSLAIYKNDTLNINKTETGTNMEMVFYSYSYLDEDKLKVLDELQSALLDAFEYYNYIVGVYPYDQIHIYEIDYYEKGGFSGSQSIFLDSETLFNNFDRKEIIKLVGEQWFGQIIGNDPIREPWISEGITSLLTMYVTNNESKINTIMQNERAFLNNYINKAKYTSLSNDVSVYTSQEEYDNIQVKRGTLAIYAIRRKFGYSKFIEFIKNYYNQNAFSIVNTHRLIEICEESYGEDLSDFFYTWMNGYSLPQFN